MVPAPGRTEKDWWVVGYQLPLSPAAVVAVANLLRRPYFERLWILQEIQLANDLSIVQCGDVEALWYYVRRGFIVFHASVAGFTPFLSPFMQRRLDHIYSLADDMQGPAYEELFHIAWYCQCGDPRDRIYSLLGLLPESITKLIEPQYSLPVAEVYKQAFFACVDVTKRLDFLHLARGIGSSAGIPTWVPGLETRRDLAYCNFVNFASGDSSAYFSAGQSGELSIQGTFCDDVKIVSSITPDNRNGIYQTARGLYTIKNGSSLRMAEEGFIDAFLWTFSCGNMHNRNTECDNYPTLKRARPMVQEIQRGEEPTIPKTFEHWYLSSLIYATSIRFFVTRKGYLGCGLANVEPGDKFCIFLGCAEPMVLRADTSRTESMQYRVVGRSYVHGLMEGQALLGPIPRPWKVVVDVDVVQVFVNKKTGKRTYQDPRLDALPGEWEPFVEDNKDNVPNYVQHHRHKVTDPRLLPDELKARGVAIETIVLI